MNSEYELCDECAGTGSELCLECEGNQRCMRCNQLCPGCNGQGSIPCQECDGEGFIASNFWRSDGT